MRSAWTQCIGCLCLAVGACGPKLQPTSQPAAEPISQAPLAIVDGQALSRDDLMPRLSEAAGARVLESFVLDRAIERELRARGLELTEQDIESEKQGLLEALAGDPGLSTSDAVRLEQRIRAARGLGHVRWRAMLARSAGLRKLVADRVDLSDDAIRLAHAQQTGERARVRVYRCATRDEASRVRSMVLDSPIPEDTFAKLAADSSTDPVARGSLLTVSPLDARVPETVRGAIQSLAEGGLSGILAEERGYALVLLVDRLESEPVPLESVREQLERQVRSRQERLLMDTEARRLLEAAGVTVFDASLDWAWGSRSE